MNANGVGRRRAAWVAFVVALATGAAWLGYLGLRTGARPGDGPAPNGAAGTTTVLAGERPEDAPVAAGGNDDGAARWYVDRNAPPLELAGQVWFEGAPAPMVRVVLDDEHRAFVHREAVSDASGHFRFASVPRIAGSFRVASTNGDRTPSWATAAGDTSKLDLEIRTYACTAHIYGDVSDASGGPVPGARVAVAEVPEVAATCDAAGRFSLCMGPGGGTVRVTASGYGPYAKYLTSRGTVRQDVVLMPEASLEGTAVLATTRAPAPYARVSARQEGDGPVEVSADESGRFVFPSLSPGAYRVEARTANAKSKAPAEVRVFASGRASVVVAVDPRATVRGRLVAAEGPVGGASVNLGFHATYEWATAARTDASGRFVLRDVPLGNVLVDVPDWEVRTPRTVRVGEAGIDDLTVEVASRGVLAVTVLRGGAPVPEAAVSLRGTNVSVTRTSNASGVATFRGLEPGTYRLVGEQGSDFATTENVQVTRTRNDRATLELDRGRTVRGRVVDEEGAPVDGARIAFSRVGTTEDAGATAASGPDGTFQGGPLRGPAVYEVRVTRSGFPLEPKGAFPRLTVPKEGPAPDLELVVKKLAQRLEGVVVDAQGGPVRDARVTLTRPERHTATLATTFTGNDGTFSLRNLGTGPYAVKATAVNGSEAQLAAISLPRETVRLVLPEVGSVRGVLRGFPASPTPSIMAWHERGYEWDFHAAVLDGNRFTIQGLPRGRYHVAATTSEASARVTFEIVGAAPVDVELSASGKRTIRGRALDLVRGTPLSNLSCQAAPDVEGGRSPVVVPGNVFTDEAGGFAFEGVPDADLYMWCMGDSAFRGGAARMPRDLGDRSVTVWGLDVRGRPALDFRALGMSFDEDHPFSHRIVTVEPKGPADRAGVRALDVIDAVEGRSTADLGNGTVRAYLALLLQEKHAARFGVRRGDATVALELR